MAGQIAGPALLDRTHLSEQTAGDEDLGRELLALFEDQCTSLVPVVSAGTPREQSAASHSLKGAALAVGAFAVAAAADAIESDLAGDGSRPAPPRLVSRLSDAVDALLAELARTAPGIVPREAKPL